MALRSPFRAFFSFPSFPCQLFFTIFSCETKVHDEGEREEEEEVCLANQETTRPFKRLDNTRPYDSLRTSKTTTTAVPNSSTCPIRPSLLPNSSNSNNNHQHFQLSFFSQGQQSYFFCLVNTIFTSFYIRAATNRQGGGADGR